MADTACLTHTGSRQDHLWSHVKVDLFTVIAGNRQFQSGKTNRIDSFIYQFSGFIIKAFFYIFTKNVVLSSPEIENILENSDFITLLNQASGDRKILSERLNLSADQQKYIDNSEPGEGLLIFENVVLPFSNPIPKNTQLYKIMTTRLNEVVEL